MSEAEQLWTAASQILKAQVSEAVWSSTFADARAETLSGNLLRIVVPNTFTRERIEGRYLALVRDALADIVHDDVRLAVEVQPEAYAPELVNVSDGDEDDTVRAPVVTSAHPGRGDGNGTGDHPSRRRVQGINPSYTFEHFVIGASNRFAHAAALRVAETPARNYNPLFIYGASGLGKTHLLHAIGHYVNDNYAHYEVRYVSTETFLNDFIDAIRTGSTPSLRRRYREVDVLLIDDIQFIERSDQLQEEFFHTFNALHGANKQMVISSDRTPDGMAKLEDRLRSRFRWGLMVDVQPPDIETRLAILRNRAERESTPVPPEVLEFIATGITNNIRELEGALIRVLAFTSLSRVPLTVEVAKDVLRELVSDRQPRQLTAPEMLEHIAEFFALPIDALRGRSRQRPLVTARQVAMYVIRELTDLSYPAIAREFGGRDHTTVMHAVEKIEGQMKERQQIYDQVTLLLQRLKRPL